MHTCYIFISYIENYLNTSSVHTKRGQLIKEHLFSVIMESWNSQKIEWFFVQNR